MPASLRNRPQFFFHQQCEPGHFLSILHMCEDSGLLATSAKQIHRTRCSFIIMSSLKPHIVRLIFCLTASLDIKSHRHNSNQRSTHEPHCGQQIFLFSVFSLYNYSFTVRFSSSFACKDSACIVLVHFHFHCSVTVH